jgi:uncharacterized membrane protein (Fun14 family)
MPEVSVSQVKSVSQVSLAVVGCCWLLLVVVGKYGVRTVQYSTVQYSTSQIQLANRGTMLKSPSSIALATSIVFCPWVAKT